MSGSARARRAVLARAAPVHPVWVKLKVSEPWVELTVTENVSLRGAPLNTTFASQWPCSSAWADPPPKADEIETEVPGLAVPE